jgi:flagellar hook-length control protein FliK
MASVATIRAMMGRNASGGGDTQLGGAANAAFSLLLQPQTGKAATSSPDNAAADDTSAYLPSASANAGFLAQMQTSTSDDDSADDKAAPSSTDATVATDGTDQSPSAQAAGRVADTLSQYDDASSGSDSATTDNPTAEDPTLEEQTMAALGVLSIPLYAPSPPPQAANAEPDAISTIDGDAAPAPADAPAATVSSADATVPAQTADFQSALDTVTTKDATATSAAQSGKTSAASPDFDPAGSGTDAPPDVGVQDDAIRAGVPNDKTTASAVHADTAQPASAGASQSATPNAAAQAATVPVQPAVAMSDQTAVRFAVAARTQDNSSADVSDLDSFGLTVAAKVVQGIRHFAIRLDPPELGRVEVRLSMGDGGTASATLIADRPQTLHLLQHDAATLSRSLQDAGVNLTGGGLNFSLRGQEKQNDDRKFAGGQPLKVQAVVADGDTTQTAEILPLHYYGPGSARLDIRV